MAKTIIIGAGGQLGQCIQKIVAERNIADVVVPHEGEANVLNTEGLQQLFERERPTVVVNCAAYTAVDKAEDEEELATAVNETGARNLAVLCKQYQALLIHVSTDFVFEGNEIKLLQEEDLAKPINVYGATKLAGENAIIEETAQHIIIRTSWLYSEFANNYVKTMLKLGAERDELNIIADQIGTPTYAVDLANVIFDIIEKPEKVYGIYHFSNEGVTSWYDFAKAIFSLSNIPVRVNPIATSAYPTKAKRPHFSVMDKTKIKKDYNIQIPYWLDSLAICVAELERSTIN